MNWLRQLFSRRRAFGDLSEEIREHLEEKIEELVAGGMSREEAATRGAARVWKCDDCWKKTAARPGDGPRSRAFSRMFATALRTLRHNPALHRDRGV